jgi:hypothetical protein
MNKQVFDGIIEICQTHAGRLGWAMGQLESKKPISTEDIQYLTDNDLAIFDQFITRFSKLQDALWTLNYYRLLLN